jgi:hypothetical protein
MWQGKALASTVPLGLLLLGVVLFAASRPAQAADPWGSGCPHMFSTPPSSTAPDADSSLVPDRPASVVLCRFRGQEPDRAHYNTLIRTVAVQLGSDAQALATRLNALPSDPDPTVYIGCFDDGSNIVALFHYPDGSQVVVRINPTGCPAATNGRIFRNAMVGDGPALISDLSAQTAYPLVCGRPLWEGSRVPVVARATRPGWYSTGSPGGRYPIALTLARGCKHGGHGLRLSSKRMLITRVVRAADRSVLAVLLTIRYPDTRPVELSAKYQSGRRVLVRLTPCLGCSAPAG